MVAAIWKPCVSVLMNLTGQRTVRAADYPWHVEYCLKADTGMAHETYFNDLCCSKMIVRDRNLLNNIRPLKDPARVAGLTGIKNITHQADLYLPVKNIDGIMTIITLEGVYYDLTFKYNLVSVTELASLNFESRFSRHQSSVHGPAGMHVPLIHTCNVYAIDATSNSNHFAFASISNMTNQEKAHLYCSHVISEAKFIHLSKSGVKGLPKGLKKQAFPCTICQHAKNIRKAAAPAVTGSDPHCVSFDMIDMSKIPTATGLRYCTMMVERETRFAHIQLHVTKDEIVQIFKRVLPMLTKKPLIIKSDCAPEYHTPELLSLFSEYGVKEVRHSNEHCQAQNGMVEIFGDTLGWGLRGALLQSGLPLSILGAAAMLITDICNSCPHSSLDNNTPFFRRTGRLLDFSFFRPFGCGMMVFCGKDLVEHKKLALRGESVFTSARAVNSGAGPSWDILPEQTVCMQA